MIIFKQLIITEKPSVAGQIAKILGAESKGDGFFYKNSDIAVSWCFGHLIELAEAKIYNPIYENWNLDHLPIIPDKFNLSIKDESSIKKQFKVLKELLHNSSLVVNAADAGREGELIFRYVYEYSKAIIPVKRLWISSLTEESIIKGLKNLKDGNEFNRLYDAARLRSISDWLIGINATRTFSLTCSVNQVLSLGRVQTPTLFMICKRYLENIHFKPTIYFVPDIKYLFEDKFYTANFQTTEDNPFPSKELALQIQKEITGKNLILADSKIEEKEEKPPYLYDLTTLQRNCNTKYGYTAKETLDNLQNLYETHKLVTYPRTDSNFLSEDLVEDVESAFNKLGNHFPQLKSYILKAKEKNTTSNKGIYDSNKVTDHHAIIPTTQNINEAFSKLTAYERNVYQEVVDCFIKAFLPNYKYQSLQYTFKIKEHFFKTSGTIVKDKGYKIELLTPIRENNNTNLPTIHKPFETSNYTVEVNNKTTTPPEILTEASLLKYMMNVQSFFKEEDLKSLKSTGGLGTPATRDSIIETLKIRKYIDASSKKLIPTDLGLFVYHLIKDVSISNPKLTSDIEEYLGRIENVSDNLTFEEALNKIKRYTEITTCHLKGLKIDSKSLSDIINKEKKTGLKCPKCKNEIFKSTKSFYCSTYPECDFTLFQTIFEKKLSQRNIEELIKGKRQSIKGFRSKQKKTFDATVFLNNEYKIELEFKNKSK